MDAFNLIKISMMNWQKNLGTKTFLILVYSRIPLNWKIGDGSMVNQSCAAQTRKRNIKNKNKQKKTKNKKAKKPKKD
jgi:hypothetical protein